MYTHQTFPVVLFNPSLPSDFNPIQPGSLKPILPDSFNLILPGSFNPILPSSLKGTQAWDDFDFFLPKSNPYMAFINFRKKI